MEKRRVALFLPNLAGGGAERVALGIAGALVERGCAVDLLLVRREGELLPLVPEGARVVELGGGRIWRSLLPLVRYLRRERLAALHAFMWPLTVIAVVAQRLARVPARVVVSDHTTLSEHASGRRERAAMRVSIGRVYPLADARVAVSVGAADDLAMLSGIDRQSIEVVPNPVDVSLAQRTSAEVEALWGVPAGERILTVGSLKETKDHRALIRAFAKLPRPEARLMIVGDGALRSELEDVSRELGIEARVVWAGFRLDPWPFYASADLFVLASRLEGQPLVLLEAMGSGLPVVSTDCAHGPWEMLEGGRYGALVPVGDAEALARAMDAALGAPVDPELLRNRAEELAGARSMERHLQLLLG
ncbi:glycosyltransferase [Sphingomonas arenae]|uniref:glycosyltransferase n=1 Tax=Sphingomonas arenae TaxID=2812555 RepID=UPI0019685FE7|nr:glycosyltransferase [Sphingomonas arenae]